MAKERQIRPKTPPRRKIQPWMTITHKDKNWKMYTYRLKENGNKDTWRPTKIDESCIKILKAEFENDSTVKDACSTAWISTQAFYDRVKSNS